MSKRGIVDTEMSSRGVWLVKVPRYLSELWEANAGSDVGKIIVSTPTNILLKSKSGLTQPTPSDGSSSSTPKNLPEEHNFIFNEVRGQNMAVLAEDKTQLHEEASFRSGRLSVEGRVVKRAECRPPGNTEYLKMKIAHIQKSLQPKKFVQQLDRAAVKFKPVNAHAEDLRRAKQKKEGAKTVRGDRDVVLQALFHAFEKHQYYRLQDLQQLTQQPAGFVKELLQEIAVYNAAPPHKSMWELKPEYRNYGSTE